MDPLILYTLAQSDVKLQSILSVNTKVMLTVLLVTYKSVDTSFSHGEVLLLYV